MHVFETLFVAALAVNLVAAQSYPANWSGTGKWMSPKYTPIFEHRLPIPADIEPKHVIDANGSRLAYYELEIGSLTQQVYPDLGPAHLTVYNGAAPGPTFRVPVGTQSLVRVSSTVDQGSSMHLHGAWTRSPWDGWADEMIQKGEFKDYFYSGAQSARTLWYHDHANHHTATDAYFGQMGFHLITDAAEDTFGLPSGPFDIPLALEDKIYQTNGDLVSPASEHTNFYGDILHVNGQPWPYLPVAPRKYRFRILNASLSRPYKLFFMADDGTTVNMSVIGSDGGLFGAPVPTADLLSSNGERYDVVFDFAAFAGRNLTLANDLRLPDVFDYDATNRVLRFVVAPNATASNYTTPISGNYNTDNNNLPATLVDQSALAQAPPPRDAVDHTFAFGRNSTTGKWTINGADYDDPAARVLARPPAGTVQRWSLQYAGGPGLHPVHIHLVDFRVVARTGGSRGDVAAYERAGLKDVVLLAPGETVEVVARFAPWAGVYMFHCHNLVHEDAEMMDVFNVSQLDWAALGYDAVDVGAFEDPDDVRFRPRKSEEALFRDEVVTATLLPSYAALGAYGREKEVLSAEEEVYSRFGYSGDAMPGAVAPATTSATGPASYGTAPTAS